MPHVPVSVRRLSPVAPSTPASLAGRLALRWKLFLYRITCFLLSYPGPLRFLFAMLRWFRPIANLWGSTFAVSKASDVREVLERFDDFTLHDILDPGIPWGPFMMTTDWRLQHDRERGLMWKTVSFPADVETVRTKAAETCRNIFTALAANPAGRYEIDVVSELAEPVTVTIAEAYFGTPDMGLDETGRAHILRHLAATILVPPPEGSERWAESRASIAAMTQGLLARISSQQATPSGDDLLARLVRQLRAGGNPAWFDEAWIRRHIMGLAATGAATIVRATTHAVDRLLAHPHALRRAQALVRRIDESDTAQQRVHADPGATSEQRQAATQKLEALRRQLQQIIYEALRFRPMLPLLVRACPRATIIAKDSARARIVPAGGKVIAGLIGAMFDPDVFDAPGRFCSARPLEDYVHFGHGPRECFGRFVADAVMLEIIRALLRAPGLERASGRRGRVGYDGPAVKSLRLTFGRNPA